MLNEDHLLSGHLCLGNMGGLASRRGESLGGLILDRSCRHAASATLSLSFAVALAVRLTVGSGSDSCLLAALAPSSNELEHSSPLPQS